jgi:hypothetical protein
MDINDYVLGNGVVTPEQQRAIAGQLRGRDNMGAIMALTGDRAVAPVGQQFMQSANKGVQQGLTHNYYQGMLRGNEADRKARLDVARMNDATNRARIGALERTAAARQNFKSMPVAMFTTLNEGTSLLKGLEELKKGFSSDMQSSFPGSGALRMTLGSKAPMFAGKDIRQYREWRANLEGWFEAARRHQLFGSALTSTEAQRWKIQALDPDATKDQIDSAIANIEKLLVPEHMRLAQAAAMQYDPNQVAALLGYGEEEETDAPPPSPEEDELAYEILPEEE